MNSKTIFFIVGPTAVGKSDVAFHFAKRIEGEIISCDSMQIYKEVNIASNKPSKDIQNKVVHHLVDICSIAEEFDVAQFNQRAFDVINEVYSKGHVPVVVGGSGMYMQILLDGIFQAGTRNEVLRKDLQIQARQHGNQFLYSKLESLDPQAAKKIHPNDLRRIIRALEIYETEKVPISQLQKERKGLWGKYDIYLFALDRERQELYDRIDVRVEQMFQEGIVEEIKNLAGAQWGQTAEKIIGVQEVRGFLRGEYDLGEAKKRMKLNTRHLAKRQLTWFRREKRLDWITVNSENAPEDIAKTLISQWESKVKTGCS